MGKRNSDEGPEGSDAELIERAIMARQASYSPYSNFAVGAALLATDGRIFTGCNIENSTYGLTMCAERVAIFKAVSEGTLHIAKMAIVADHERLPPPCGCCRQMIWEFGADVAEVILANLSGDIQKFEVRELFPLAFDADFLPRAR